jgi:hypothetical protein
MAQTAWADQMNFLALLLTGTMLPLPSVQIGQFH